MKLKKDALEIIDYAIKSADPYSSTKKILESLNFQGQRITVLSIGKAAVPMASAAQDFFGSNIYQGVLVTKYNHIGSFTSPYFKMIEAGHPVSDDNSIKAAETVLNVCEQLKEDDALIVLLSGGGSALLEKSVIPAEIQRKITEKLLSSGTDINSINTIRKCISLVKGGKIAKAAYPASVYTVALSDVLNNDMGTIASGITVADNESFDHKINIIRKYIPEYEEYLKEYIVCEDECKINNCGYYFAGDINSLCDAAQEKAKELGYNVFEGSRALCGEAKEICEKLIDSVENVSGKNAYIYGGETTVTIKGNGLGGRNQEMSLAAAIKIKNRPNILFASVGSDGTDGPTDAAGGIVDCTTYECMRTKGLSPEAELENNNSYFALSCADALIITGPTGTNVNDLTLILTDF